MLQHGGGAGEVVGAAEERLDLGDEDVRVEGLGDEVVCAHVDGHDDVHVVRGGGDEDDRDGGGFADLRAPVVAVHERQGDIHEDQVRAHPFKVRHDVAEIRYGFRRQAPHDKAGLHGFRDGFFVLDDQDTVFFHVCLL